MGCISSRTNKSLSDRNSNLVDFEKTLGFYRSKPVYIEAVYSRLSKTGADTSQALNSFLNACEVYLPPGFEKMLSLQINEFEHRILRLYAIYGILISNKSNQTKAETLWYLYDSTMLNRLTKLEFGNLLKDVIKASYLFSVDIYMLRLLEQADIQEMTNYKYFLFNRENSLYLKFHKKFIDNSDMIQKESFLRNIQEESWLNITSTHSLRHELEHVREMPSKYSDSFQNLKKTRLT